jgi:hypothetical protein
MSLMLAVDPVELYPPGGLDAHGQREPGVVPSWIGEGNLQLFPGPSDPRGAGGGGRGAYQPAADEAGNLYLPPEAAVTEGMAALIRGRMYVLSRVRQVVDPIGVGAGLGCWTATVTGTGKWGGDDGG